MKYILEVAVVVICIQYNIYKFIRDKSNKGAIVRTAKAVSSK